MTTNYLIPVGDTIRHAWRKVSGAKATVWGAFIIMVIIAIVLGLLEGIIAKVLPPVVTELISIFVQFIHFLLQAGLLYIGIQRAADFSINYQMLFRAFEWRIAWRIILVNILQGLLMVPFIIIMMIPTFIRDAYKEAAFSQTSLTFLFVICAIIGVLGIIFITVRFCLALALVLDRITGPLEALKQSFNATRNNGFRVLGIIILEALIFLISLIPLGIGMIWSIPFLLIVYGLMYRRLSANLQPMQPIIENS